MTEPMATEHKRRRRAGWKISAALLLVTLVGLGIAASMRQALRTVYLPQKIGGTTLVVQMPAQFQSHLSDDAAVLIVSPPRPTGLFRWWGEHVLKMNVTLWRFEEIAISFNERTAPNRDSGHRELEAVMQLLAADRRRIYRNVTLAPITQADMAGYDLEASSYKGNLWGDGDERYVMLNHYDSVSHSSLMITVRMRVNARNYSLLKPTMDEIIHRLKLVQEK